MQPHGLSGQHLLVMGITCCNAGNSPHIHPRGAEIVTVVRGVVQFGFVEENSGQNRLIVLDVSAGQVQAVTTRVELSEA